jgi:hypothetical protein
MDIVFRHRRWATINESIPAVSISRAHRQPGAVRDGRCGTAADSDKH